MVSEPTIRQVPVESYRFADDGCIPNNPDLPLVVYRGLLTPGGDAAAAFEAIFSRHGWSNGWRDGIYDFHHFHSTAHEVLGIATGQGHVRFGGERGKTIELRAGDLVVIPAGVGHKKEGASADLLVIGAYADGRDWDLCRGEPGERPRVLDAIRQVPLPTLDPVFGAAGPLVGL